MSKISTGISAFLDSIRGWAPADLLAATADYLRSEAPILEPGADRGAYDLAAACEEGRRALLGAIPRDDHERIADAAVALLVGPQRFVLIDALIDYLATGGHLDEIFDLLQGWSIFREEDET